MASECERCLKSRALTLLTHPWNGCAYRICRECRAYWDKLSIRGLATDAALLLEEAHARLLRHRPEPLYRTQRDCWPWDGAYEGAYGVLRIDRHAYGVHRLSAAIWLGLALEDRAQLACHNCPGGDNPACWNPAHLFIGTSADNNADRRKKGVRAVHADRIRAMAEKLGVTEATAASHLSRELAPAERLRRLEAHPAVREYLSLKGETPDKPKRPSIFRSPYKRRH